MDRIVRTYQEVRPCPFQPVRRTQNQFCHTLPVLLAIQEIHVFSQADGVHRDLRMSVYPHHRFCFQADGPVAERRAFRTGSDNPDMFAHDAWGLNPAALHKGPGSNILPAENTADTLRMSLMFSTGLPSTMITSARLPGSIVPESFSRPITFAGTTVAA